MLPIENLRAFLLSQNADELENIKHHVKGKRIQLKEDPLA